MTNQIYTHKYINDQEMNDLRGNFFDLDHYNNIFDSDVDVYNTEDELLFILRKNVIPNELSNLGIKTFMNVAKKKKSNNRGIASGPVDISKMSSNVDALLDPGNFKTKVKYKNGNVSKYRISNQVNSMIAGNYNHHIHGKGATKFVKENKKPWEEYTKFVQYIDELYREYLPFEWRDTNDKINNNEYRIADTIFTTITINYNFRTAAHKDAGNLDRSYSAFVVCEQGEWEGSYLGYPEYKVAANVRQGDLLIMNPHIYHCNTERIGDGDRLSFVLYTRAGLI